MSEKKIKKIRRHKKIRAKIKGTVEIPRLCVFRSNKHIYVQLINDETSQMILSLSDMKSEKKESKTSSALNIGKEIAKKAMALKIKKIVFDRGGFRYHGRVKAVAEGAREGGLEF